MSEQDPQLLRSTHLLHDEFFGQSAGWQAPVAAPPTHLKGPGAEAGQVSAVHCEVFQVAAVQLTVGVSQLPPCALGRW